jgi:GT2 family glycosyltransferase
MKISVIIITYNRRDDLKVSLEGFLAQTYQDKEIIVIDNDSQDNTQEMMATEYPFIKYHRMPVNLDILSINVGIKMSSGDIIWRTDDDSHPESKETFTKVAEIFKTRPNVDIISSENIEVNNNYSVWEWYPHKVDKKNIPPDGYKSNFFPGSGAAIKREIFDKIGGFWEFGFEELEFCTRAILAGYNIRYFPNIRTLHYSSSGGEVPIDRWIKFSCQFMRYNWRYFSFFRVLGRTFLIIFFQLLIGIISGYRLSSIFECSFAMLATIFSTFRKERKIAPKNKLKDITLGVSYFHSQISYFRQMLSYRIGKWRKK